MAHFSDTLENAILDHVFRNTAYTAPTTVYVGLFTAAPTDAGGGTEVTGNAYARQAVTFGAASGGAIANSGAVTFPVATPSSWGTIVAVGLFSLSSGGTLLAWNTITNKAIDANDQASFPIGDIDVTLD